MPHSSLRTALIALCLIALSPHHLIASSPIDMQAHVACDEGRAAYTDYLTAQEEYYYDDCQPAYLFAMSGDELFGRLNSLLGNTCMLVDWNKSYNTLRYEYVNVDRDLNREGYIIGYYDGKQILAQWDSGKTWNREHTWPQSKGANKSIPMGHDMQSVRPTSTSVNSNRGNTAYGEGSGFYNPDHINIVHEAYKPENMGSYRGDAARVILYDYLMYGEAGGYKNRMYNGNAQLLQKLGSYGVFESIHVLLKWHMQDPPSLTEMVRNDGAQEYQGNRNPVIDYPELAIELFADYADITRYPITYELACDVSPRYMHTLSDGFVAYVSKEDGTHPTAVAVSGADYSYDAELGRLIISNVSGPLTIGNSTATENVLANSDAASAVRVYDLRGEMVATAKSKMAALSSLPQGLYIVLHGSKAEKVMKK